MKTVKVVAAVICDSLQEKKQIFTTARGYGELKGQWEFPGGKIEAGETLRQALVREIKEELEAEAAKWLTQDMLYDVQWLPADFALVEKIKEQIPGICCR